MLTGIARNKGEEQSGAVVLICINTKTHTLEWQTVKGDVINLAVIS